MSDRQLQIKEHTTYKVVDYHRRKPNPNKSVWDTHISCDDEIDLFKLALKNVWTIKSSSKRKHFAWGILSNGGRLGTGITPTKKALYVAKFKDENLNLHFHGYPIDYTYVHDRVPKPILNDWKIREIITKVQMSRMGRGFDCH